jgi:hypothetical protein
MHRNKKFSKKRKNVFGAISKTEPPRRENLIFEEFSLSPRITSNYPRFLRGDRFTIDRTPDIICLASSDDEDCRILSDVEQSPNTSQLSDETNRRARRSTLLKSPSAVCSDVVYISSSDEEDCLILSDIETPTSRPLSSN